MSAIRSVSGGKMGVKTLCGQEGDMLLEKKKKKLRKTSQKRFICAAEMKGNNNKNDWD